MPPTKATVSYKKKDGSLTVSEDKKYLFWTPATPAGASPTITIPVAEITNLQQTPESSPKVALKVFVKDENYVFSFTHASNARKEQETVTETLRNTIAANKASTAVALAPTTAPAPGSSKEDGGQSAAMTFAKAVSSKAADEGWYDDNKLKSDIGLQQSLFESNKALKDRFEQSLRDKPETVSISQFTGHFWSTRVHLLRAHAIEKAQAQGEYNVLPEIRFVRKPAEKEGEPDTKQLQITKEQIKLIFKQYPIVSVAYSENCPPLNPGEFWTRFFNSRLLKKLKGEKITQQDPPDPILDKYLERKESGPASMSYIPHFIDLEGNEQNHSQRKGNRPDQDMRPSSYDKVPILRILNSLSEKMLSHVAAEDGEAHAPIGLDEDTFEQLRLRDLAKNEIDNRVVLHVKEQQRHVGGEQDDLSAEAKLYAKQDPRKVLASLSADLRPSHFGSNERGTLRLDMVIGFNSDDNDDGDDDDDDSDSETERAGAAPAQSNGTAAQGTKQREPARKKRKAAARIGSHAAMSAASRAILASVRRRRDATSSSSGGGDGALNGLSQATFDNLTMTQNTTVEFLHYFWTLFLSGDAARAGELAQMVGTLDRSLDLINAVGAAAEAERGKKVEAARRQVQEYYRRTGKRRTVDVDAAVPGGRAVVEQMVRPTVQALATATAAYRKAFDAQTKEAAPAALAG